LLKKNNTNKQYNVTLRCVISVVCVTNEKEESVVNQHNLFRKMFIIRIQHLSKQVVLIDYTSLPLISVM